MRVTEQGKRKKERQQILFVHLITQPNINEFSRFVCLNLLIANWQLLLKF